MQKEQKLIVMKTKGYCSHCLRDNGGQDPPSVENTARYKENALKDIKNL